MTNKSPLRKEIYWADLEPVKGSEQGGSRPVLIMSNILMNKTAPICIAIPVTRPGEKVKNYPFNIEFEKTDWLISDNSIRELESLGHSYAGQGGFILCNQARAFSKDRLLVKMGTFTNEDKIDEVENAIIHSFGLNACDSCETPLRPNGLNCPKCRKRHHQKCFGCNRINPIDYKYCPNCGRGVR